MNVRSLLQWLSLVAVGVQTIGALGGAVFYAVLLRRIFAAHPDVPLGLDGFAAAGALMFAVGCTVMGAVSAALFVALWKRSRPARFVAPVPALVGAIGFAAWLLSGDPGDEAWVRVALVAEATLFAVCFAGSIVPPGQPASTTSSKHLV